MDVYAVIETIPYETVITMAIFSTREGAETFLAHKQAQFEKWARESKPPYKAHTDHLSIEVHTLDHIPAYHR